MVFGSVYGASNRVVKSRLPIGVLHLLINCSSPGRLRCFGAFIENISVCFDPFSIVGVGIPLISVSLRSYTTLSK